MARRRLLPGLAACLYLLLLAPQAGAEDPGARLEEVRKELEDVQHWLQQARSRQDQLNNTLRKNEEQIGRLERDLRGQRRELARLRAEETTLQRERQALQRQVRQQREALRRQIRAQFMRGREGHIRLVLNQKNPDEMARVTRYFAYVQAARQQRIREFRTLVEEAEAQALRLQRQRDRVGEAAKQLEQRRLALQNERQARGQTLAKLQRGIVDRDARARQLERDRAELEELLERLLRSVPELALDRQETPFATLRGKLPWPANGRIISGFGRAGRSVLHRNGLEIGARAGSEVRAIHSGHVVFADWMRQFGLLIIVDHGGGFLSLYGHNESLLKHSGEWVSPGETIAMVGDSGGQEKPGLYFELRRDGKPVDPKPWLSARR